MDDDLEGWCTDPFGRHEARWLSKGDPTKLVRDGDVESYDEPPDEPPTKTPVPIGGKVSQGAADVTQPDTGALDESPFNQAEAAMRRAWDMTR